MWSYTSGLLKRYKSYLDDEIDEGFWLRYMLSTWLRQVVDELMHIHEVYSWWCWYILMSHSWWLVDTWLVHTFYMVGCTCLCYRLITGWLVQVCSWLMHLFMVQVHYRLVHGWCTFLWYRLITGWCMVQIYWYRFTAVYLTVTVWQWFHHFTYNSGWQDGTRIGGCSHLLVVSREHRGL